jgi:hypothetical protein
MFFERLKKIKNLTDKLNIIINIIVGFCIATKLDALESDVTTEPNVFRS